MFIGLFTVFLKSSLKSSDQGAMCFVLDLIFGRYNAQLSLRVGDLWEMRYSLSFSPSHMYGLISVSARKRPKRPTVAPCLTMRYRLLISGYEDEIYPEI